MVNPDVDDYTRSLNQRKILRGARWGVEPPLELDILQNLNYLRKGN